MEAPVADSPPESGEVPRYRMEEGRPCIDVRAGAIEELFDNRDPAPFLGRDLDPGLVEYLRESAEDLAAHAQLRVVFWMERPCARVEIEDPYRGHFAYLLERLWRQRRRRRRSGLIALVVSFAILAALQSVAQVVPPRLPAAIAGGVREGLVILSWVVMWRPVEILLYDWIPARRERKIASRLYEAAIAIRPLETAPPSAQPELHPARPRAASRAPTSRA